MTTVHARLQLTSKRWFGWQMLPGYVAKGNVPHFSPIWVEDVTPRKTGRRILIVRFIMYCMQRECRTLLSTSKSSSTNPITS